MPTNGNNPVNVDKTLRLAKIEKFLSNHFIRSFDCVEHIRFKFQAPLLALFYCMFAFEIYMIIDLAVAGGYHYSFFGGVTYTVYIKNVYLSFLLELTYFFVITMLTLVGTLRFYITSKRQKQQN